MLSHPNIKSLKFSVEGKFDGPHEMILTIETNLPMNPQRDDYDDAKVEEVIQAAHTYVARENRQFDTFRLISASGDET